MRFPLATLAMVCCLTLPAAAQEVYRGPETLQLRVTAVDPSQPVEFRLIGASLSFNPHPDRLLLGDTITLYGEHELTIKAVTEDFELIAADGSGDLKVEALPLLKGLSDPVVLDGRAFRFTSARPKR